MLRLLFLAGVAAAQFPAIPVRLALANQDDFEDVLQVPASQVSPQGLVIVQSQTQTFTSSSPLSDLVQTFFGGFGQAPQEFVVTRYDDDSSEETHDFGCPCGADVQKLCPGNEGDDLASVFETRLCLARAKDYLSEACFAHLSEAPTVVEYCADDIARGCPGVAPGGNRVHACLAAQEALSGPCGRYVASVGPAAGAEPAYREEASDLVRSAFSLLDAFAARHAADDEVLEKADDWAGFAPREALQPGGPFTQSRAARGPPQPWSPFFDGRYELGRPAEAGAVAPPRDWTNHLGLFNAFSAARAAARDQPDNRPPAVAPLAAAGWAPAATLRGGSPRGDQAPDWQELYAAMEERYEEEETAEEEAAEEERYEEAQDERVAALANLLLALAFLGMGMAAFVLSYVAAYAMRKRRERQEVEAFKAKFAPLMKEAAESS